MDKILRRVRMAERQVARRAKRQAKVEASNEKWDRIRDVARVRREAATDIYSSIKARHEDRNLGSIAPRRDTSKVNQFGNYYGAISSERALLQTTITEEQKKARAAWAGGVKYLCIKPGDRVVVTEGPYRGRIAKVQAINKETMVVDLGQETPANVMLPPFMVKGDQLPVEQVGSAVPLSAVRLVHPITDPKTGAVRDAIIRELKPIEIDHDRPTRTTTWERLVPGLNIKIPWPPKQDPVYEDHPADTLRIDVEEHTFVPTLLRPPMPEVVIDELRSKYSKFRTRHTPEYVAKIAKQEAAKKARQKSVNSMLLPLQEYNRKLRVIRRARGQPVLTNEMLEKIGEVIAKNKTRRAGGEVSQEEKLREAVEQLTITEETTAPETDLKV
ncbi:hypothetical protein QBC38DRAFT_132996 [Podospora fimiseda]|uniref:KOW domain-containing protein n=1 Tax=Podospora fimiseda TaxID=252190 RepID=A0AAN7BT37_9PEZI|nr:hypothetical protein QBC38DRAFT_132996 [Podospora fimiseda]